MSDLVDLSEVRLFPEVAESVLGTDPIGSEVLGAMLQSFEAGRWGAVPEDVWTRNDEAVLMGGVVVGVYNLTDELGVLLQLLAAATGSPMVETVCILTRMGDGTAVVLTQHELEASWQQFTNEHPEV